MTATLAFVRRFFRELLLQSGQFALFYLLIQFSSVGLGVFTDFGHTALFTILVLQTSVLVLWGEHPWVRFLGSLIAPLCYTFLETLDSAEFLLNSAHAGFWVFSLLTGGLQSVALTARRLGTKLVLEFLLTLINVVIFFLLYFYFDTMTSVTNKAELGLDKIGGHLPEFLKDPTHLYIVWGGLLLAFGLALGRTQILRLKERLNTLFGQYVDQGIRDEILGGRGLQSRQVDLAVLFSDLRNFTSCSEGADPAAVTEMLNLYFTKWTEVVRRHGGVVDKFIGDAVMVLFGLKGFGGAASSAASCGLEMLASWPQLRQEFVKRGLPVPDGLGIGLHAGPVVLGDIGSEERRNFTVIGDTVNTASRLESACKDVGKTFLVSAEVRNGLSAELAARCVFVGALALKGKQEKHDVWSLEG
jgi:class 3 adenylate cyclase